MEMKKPVVAILADFPLFLVDESFPRKGWYYMVWLETLYGALHRQNQYEIHWVVFRRGLWRAKRFCRNGQYFHVLPAMQGNLSQFLHYRFDCRRAHRELRAIAPDIIHAWGTETRYGIAAATYTGECRKILSMQGILTALLARAPMPAYYHRQVRFEAATMNAFDVITSESEWGWERCSEIVPGGRVQRWEYAPAPLFFQVERRLSDTPTCLMAGTAEPMKNVPTAIAAFRRPELSQVQLLLAGVEDGLIPDLPPNVKPLGGVPHERMAEILSSCWCLVHPSLGDTCPNIIKEARVAGVAVITSTECGGKQYVADGKSGFVIKPTDAEGLARCVNVVTSHAETALQMGQYEQDLCRRELCAETMVQGMFRLYASLL